MFEGVSLGKIGGLLTGLYILFLGLLIWWKWPNFQTLEPNAWGDFLAGAFGPLALAWIVLGFFLQGKELGNSVEQIRLQTEELTQSVDAQKQMAEAASSDLALQELRKIETNWIEARKIELDIKSAIASNVAKIEKVRERKKGKVGSRDFRNWGGEHNFNVWINQKRAQFGKSENDLNELCPIESISDGGPSAQKLIRLYELRALVSELASETSRSG